MHRDSEPVQGHNAKQRGIQDVSTESGSGGCVLYSFASKPLLHVIETT